MEELQMTLVKTKTYSLKPFGRFLIKWQCSDKVASKPNILPFSHVRFDNEKGMPYTAEQEKLFEKFMIKHHTDVLTDGRSYYTRMGENIVEIFHNKLQSYWLFLQREQAEDSKESWDKYVEIRNIEM